MKTVWMYSGLLALGLVMSQVLPGVFGDSWGSMAFGIKMLTMFCLAFIMIHVGMEFDLDRKNLRPYGWDYFVAFTAAAFPWIFCAVYFVFVLMPQEQWGLLQSWKESLLAARFASPTSAGVLFSMLAAAGLAGTWLYRKARVLAIFDDLDTVLLMIPLKMMMVGMRWQLGIVVIIMAVLLYLAYRYLHEVRWPTGWKALFTYSVVIVAVCEGFLLGSELIDPDVPIHMEVLLPAFALGCMLARPHDAHPAHGTTATADVAGAEAHHELAPADAHAHKIVSAAFMVFVGLSMPHLGGSSSGGGDSATGEAMGWGTIALHVIAITIISNIGKMFPALCYRREVGWRTRLAVAIAMFPRGEVGAGVLVVSLSYGISGGRITVALLSLALNLLLTGGFIALVIRLLKAEERASARAVTA